MKGARYKWKILTVIVIFLVGAGMWKFDIPSITLRNTPNVRMFSVGKPQNPVPTTQKANTIRYKSTSMTQTSKQTTQKPGTITKKSERSPQTKLKEPTSHFIYSEPKDMQLKSLTYSCPTCKPMCIKVTDEIPTDCKSDQCLCYKQSPINIFPRFWNNSNTEKDFMLKAEQITLGDTRITDLKTLPDLSQIKISVQNGKRDITLGENVQLRLTIFNNLQMPSTRGGDDIRVFMIEEKKKMTIAGRVRDLNNGTYIITIPTLWTGHNKIKISIPYFREESATIFRWYRQFGTLFYHYGYFKGKNISQKTLCSSASSTIPGYKEMCDLTFYNGGEPWFCGKPTSPYLKCNDIAKTFDYRFIDIGVTEAEESTFRRECTHRYLTETAVTVTGSSNTVNKLPDCKNVHPSMTWNMSQPTGYFNGTRYHPTYCQVNTIKPNITKCLQNTTLVLTGDSTVLQWYKKLIAFSKCSVVTSKLSTGKWYEESLCVTKNWQFNLKFVPHNMPFSSFETKLHKHIAATKSMATVLDEIPNKGRYIFMLHLYAHFTRMHYNVFRNKLLALKPALRNALNRNKDLKVVIKSPHVYDCVGWVPCINDFMGRHLITILQQELKEFSSQVIYLDYWDMTVAKENRVMHANDNVIQNMLDLMFEFTC